MISITIDYLSQYSEELIRSGDRDLAKFKERLETNPAYAFEWSQNTFPAAAKIHVGRCLKEWITNKATIDGIMYEINKIVVRAVRWPERSTSQQSNIMKQEIAAVWAEIAAKERG